MEYICGMTYAPFARKGSYQEKRAFDSLRKMKENTNSNFVILAPNGLQQFCSYQGRPKKTCIHFHATNQADNRTDSVN